MTQYLRPMSDHRSATFPNGPAVSAPLLGNSENMNRLPTLLLVTGRAYTVYIDTQLVGFKPNQMAVIT